MLNCAALLQSFIRNKFVYLLNTWTEITLAASHAAPSRPCWVTLSMRWWDRQTNGQMDGRQTVTLCFPLDVISIIIWSRLGSLNYLQVCITARQNVSWYWQRQSSFATISLFFRLILCEKNNKHFVCKIMRNTEATKTGCWRTVSKIAVCRFLFLLCVCLQHHYLSFTAVSRWNLLVCTLSGWPAHVAQWFDALIGRGFTQPGRVRLPKNYFK